MQGGGFKMQDARLQETASNNVPLSCILYPASCILHLALARSGSVKYNRMLLFSGSFFIGAVPKWLRERSAKPRCSGSSPLGASSPILKDPKKTNSIAEIENLCHY